MKRSFAVLLVSCFLLPVVAQEARKPVSVPEGTMQELLILRVKPVPPDDAGHVQGEVALKAAIDKTGSVESLELMSGNPLLVPAAIEAVKQWKYRPYEVNGIPVAVEATIRLEFSTASGNASSDSTPQSPVSISRDNIGGHIVRRVAPIYPPLARQARIQGTVILRVIIDKEGNVSNLRLVSGHPMLVPAAIEAVKQWKYTPYELNGEIVAVETDVQVNFKMADDPPGRGVPYAPNPAAPLPSGALGGVIGGVLSSTPTPLSEMWVAEATMRPLRVKKVDPIYPPLAVQAHLQGIVGLNVRISSSGDVETVTLISGHPMLAPAAIEALKQWKYHPYVNDGKEIAVATIVQLNFTLAGDALGRVTEPPAFDGPMPRSGASQWVSGVPQRIQVSSGVSSGLLVKKVQPQYPPDARDGHIQGTVVLHANINKEGNVANLELISGHPMLAPPAMDAVRQWKYKPYLLNGEAVEVDTQIQVSFMLAP
jgi:TonB family protein